MGSIENIEPDYHFEWHSAKGVPAYPASEIAKRTQRKYVANLYVREDDALFFSLMADVRHREDVPTVFPIQILQSQVVFDHQIGLKFHPDTVNRNGTFTRLRGKLIKELKGMKPLKSYKFNALTFDFDFTVPDKKKREKQIPKKVLEAIETLELVSTKDKELQRVARHIASIFRMVAKN